MPRSALSLVLAALVCSCGPDKAGTQPPDGAAKAQPAADPLAVLDDLEGHIAEGRASEAERKSALDRVRAMADDGSAGYAFARAAIAGRVAELRGVKAGKLVGEAESWAERSRERDVEFRGHAATRMLGSLWVMAPPRLLEHGDSEKGLEMLEDLTATQPDAIENHLRLAEAYVFLSDPDPAMPHLCRARDGAAALRADERKLLERLVDEIERDGDLTCTAAPAVEE